MTISEVYQIVGKQKGLDSFVYPSELDADEREQLYDGTADYIITNGSGFTLSQIEWAKKRRASSLYNTPIEEYSVGDAVSDFGNEFANQAVQINEAVNPFSESNRGKILWLAVAGVAIYFLAPVIIKAIAENKAAQ